ncbi:MAG: hypothetical protein ABSF10_12850 [Verrucomicrobiota bacterium]|jgi:hypothetical protein
MNRSNGKWWLAAILLPVMGFGAGYFFAVIAPHNQSDWFGGAVLGRIFLGLFVGCILSCIATGISVATREKLWGLSLLGGIPSLLLIVNVCIEIPKAVKGARESNKSFIAYQKREQARETRIQSYCNELRTNSSLITSDDFWNGQTNQDFSAQYGLDRLIEDQSFKVTPEMNEYLIKKFPGRMEELMRYKRLSQNELIKVIKGVQYSRRIRETGVYVLISDKSFDVTDEWKKYIVDQFPSEIGDLLLHECFTKSEVEGLVADPKISDSIKELAKRNLAEGRYKMVNGP